jgi:hypothetical protein
MSVAQAILRKEMGWAGLRGHHGVARTSSVVVTDDMPRQKMVAVTRSTAACWAWPTLDQEMNSIALYAQAVSFEAAGDYAQAANRYRQILSFAGPMQSMLTMLIEKCTCSAAIDTAVEFGGPRGKIVGRVEVGVIPR